MKLKLKGKLVEVSFLPPDGVELKLKINRESKEDNLAHKLRVLLARLDPVEITISDEDTE